MDQEHSNPQRYRWPWFVLAAVLLAIVLAIVWVAIAAREVHERRDPFTAPRQTPAPARSQ